MTVPAPVGVNEAEQEDTVVLTLTRLQGAPVNEPDAVPVLLKDTVPSGADGVPVAVSLTNAVQLVAWATTILLGEQDTTIEVDRPPTLTVLLSVGPLPL
jgi:hypothetical protein